VSTFFPVDAVEFHPNTIKGTIFNLANLLLVVAIQLIGLSTAFPLGIGTALVGGTILTYVIDQTGNPYFLFPGVGLALMAVIAMAVAHAKMDAGSEGGMDGGRVNTGPTDAKTALLGGSGGDNYYAANTTGGSGDATQDGDPLVGRYGFALPVVLTQSFWFARTSERGWCWFSCLPCCGLQASTFAWF
jgi:hypothetical protein